MNRLYSLLILTTIVVLAAGSVFAQRGGGHSTTQLADPPVIEDQFFAEAVCDLTTERQIQIVASDPDNDDFWFVLVSGPGAIDSATGLLSYVPDTSGVFIFEVAAVDTSGADTALVTDSLVLNSPPSVNADDSTVYLCSPEEVCFPVTGDDADGDDIQIRFLEGIGEFTQDGPNSGATCFMPADVDSATYRFIFRAFDSCMTEVNSEALAPASNPPCCPDTAWITVIINQPPELACPKDEILVSDCSLEEFCFEVDAVDPDGDDVTITIIDGDASYIDGQVCFPVGDNDTSFSLGIEAADTCGNADTCYVDVSIDCGGEAFFDLKPTSCPNPITFNANGNSVLPAAILGTEEFDVRDIDPETIRLEGVAPIRWNFEDVTTPVYEPQDSCDCTEEGKDGFEDMTLKFRRSEIIDAIYERMLNNSQIVMTIEFELYDGRHFEATDCLWLRGGGRGSGASTSLDEEGTATTRATGLIGNHPNPFNPTTEISFYLAEPGHVTVEVYNISGRRVAVLTDQALSSGEHTVTWDGRDAEGTAVASGVYLYRLQTNSFTETRKMMLVK